MAKHQHGWLFFHSLPATLTWLQLGLAIRYMRDLTDLPSKCDGCGASLTMQHALDCIVGGLVIQRHNEIRGCIGDIAAQVVMEPIVREAETHR